MEARKSELEKKVRDLTAVYSEMLKELATQYDSIEVLRKELSLAEQNFDNMHLLVDCVSGRLGETKQLLNMVYNGEEFIPMNNFLFSRAMVKSEEEKEVI